MGFLITFGVIFLIVYLLIGLFLLVAMISIGDPRVSIVIIWPLRLISMARDVDKNIKLHTTAGTYKSLYPDYVASGEQRITIKYKLGISVVDDREGREVLIKKFKKIGEILAVFKCRVCWGHISVSDQTVEAVLPAHLLDELVEKMEAGPYSFDKVKERQVESE